MLDAYFVELLNLGCPVALMQELALLQTLLFNINAQIAQVPNRGILTCRWTLTTVTTMLIILLFSDVYNQLLMQHVNLSIYSYFFQREKISCKTFYVTNVKHKKRLCL